MALNVQHGTKGCHLNIINAEDECKGKAVLSMPEAYHSKCNLTNWENRLFINTNLLELYNGRLSLWTTPEPGEDLMRLSVEPNSAS